MKIHEYQGKEILRKYGVPTLRGKPASTPEEAEAIATIFQNQLQDALNTVKVKPAKLTRSRRNPGTGSARA